MPSAEMFMINPSGTCRPDRGLFYPMHTSRQLANDSRGTGATWRRLAHKAWHKARDDMNEDCKPGGIVISFGWSSVGMGKRRGYQLIDGLLMCHGSDRPDTIAVVEQKLGNSSATTYIIDLQNPAQFHAYFLRFMQDFAAAAQGVIAIVMENPAPALRQGCQEVAAAPGQRLGGRLPAGSWSSGDRRQAERDHRGAEAAGDAVAEGRDCHR